MGTIPLDSLDVSFRFLSLGRRIPALSLASEIATNTFTISRYPFKLPADLGVTC